MDDAVGGVLERQGQLCGCEASEEGQRQSCQGAFAGAGLADQKQNKLRLAFRLRQKMVQRRQEGQRQQRKQHSLLSGPVCQHTPQHRQVLCRPLFLCAVAPELPGQLHRVSPISRQQELPLSVYLLPPGHGVDGFPQGMFCRVLDGVAHSLLDVFANLQNAVHAPVRRQPVEECQLLSRDFDFRQLPAVLVGTPELDPGVRFRAVIQGDFLGDIRREVTQLLLDDAFPGQTDFRQAAVHQLEAVCVTVDFFHKKHLTSGENLLPRKKISGAVSILHFEVFCDTMEP